MHSLPLPANALNEKEAKLLKFTHRAAGVLALLIILTFWLSTVIAEIFGSHATVTAVKSAIPWGFLFLVPMLAMTSGTGFTLAKGRRPQLVSAKIVRVRMVAANGVLVLIPSAFFLLVKAKAGDFNWSFYAVQAAELVAGAVNIFLLGLNMRDGLKMAGRFRPHEAQARVW
jgi:hypothetical protein